MGGLGDPCCTTEGSEYVGGSSSSKWFDKWNAVAQAASSVLWIVNQLVIIGSVFEAMRSGDWELVGFVALIYVTASVAGSVFSHWILLRIEKDSMRVGYYEDGNGTS